MDSMEPKTLEFTTEELKALYDLVRQAKVTATTEELLSVTLGKAQSPLLSVVYKVMSSWQETELEIQKSLNTPPPE